MTLQSQNTVNKGLVLNFYRAVGSQSKLSTESQFIIWGYMDFMKYDIMPSLSELFVVNSKNKLTNDSNGNIETKQLILYKSVDEHTSFDYILQSNNEYPLLVISQGYVINSSPLHSSLEKAQKEEDFIFDVFSTFGHGSKVLIFRTKYYENVTNFIINNLNIFTDVYSISGIQTNNFHKLSKSYNKDTSTLITNVSIKYILKKTNDSGNPSSSTVSSIKNTYRDFINKYSLDDSDLNIEINHELGRFDIELRLCGRLNKILDILLLPEFGFANVESKFVEKHVAESFTTWQTFQHEN